LHFDSGVAGADLYSGAFHDHTKFNVWKLKAFIRSCAVKNIYYYGLNYIRTCAHIWMDKYSFEGTH
jgi:hypothetical protein